MRKGTRLSPYVFHRRTGGEPGNEAKVSLSQFTKERMFSCGFGLLTMLPDLILCRVDIVGKVYVVVVVVLSSKSDYKAVFFALPLMNMSLSTCENSEKKRPF